MAAIVVQPDAVERIAQPSDWSNVSRYQSQLVGGGANEQLCAGMDVGAWGPD
jgi:hypothetical protein